MQEFLKDILFAVITAAVPVLTAYLVVLIRKVGENAAANTESVKAKTYIMEAAEAIAAAVAATNQTYVSCAGRDNGKRGGSTGYAGKEAGERKLSADIPDYHRGQRKRVSGLGGNDAGRGRRRGPDTYLLLPPL